MTRLLLAGGVAVAAHLLLFSLPAPFDHHTRDPVPHQVVTLSLGVLPPPAAKPAPRRIPAGRANPILPLPLKAPPKPAPERENQASPRPPANVPAPSRPGPASPEPQPAEHGTSEERTALATKVVDDSVLLKMSHPLYDRNPPLTYPRLARRRGYQGTVVLNVRVSSRGSVLDISLDQSSGYAVLDKHAVESVRAWRFAPGRRGDAAVEMWVKVPVRYELH